MSTTPAPQNHKRVITQVEFSCPVKSSELMNMVNYTLIS